jgi:hypothetical protein
MLLLLKGLLLLLGLLLLGLLLLGVPWQLQVTLLLLLLLVLHCTCGASQAALDTHHGAPAGRQRHAEQNHRCK